MNRSLRNDQFHRILPAEITGGAQMGCSGPDGFRGVSFVGETCRTRRQKIYPLHFWGAMPPRNKIKEVKKHDDGEARLQ